jgi:hypothetical protein
VIAQKAAPSALAGDAIGAVLCSITLSDGSKSVSGLTLSISQKQAPAASAALFQYISPSLSELVTTSQPLATSVEGLVTAPGEFGITDKPGLWQADGLAGVELTSSIDQSSLLLNLSSQPTQGAYYDGSHLFVCNGPRVLIYNGLPSSPSVRPAVVLGQPDIDTIDGETTSSLFGATLCTGIWSDGKRLAVVNSSRVLIWNSIPTKNLTPADLVLGQPDFSSNRLNNPSVSSATLDQANAVDSDGTRFVVADTWNNRVLLWNTFPTVIDQPADFVIGQPGFTTNTNNNGATSIYLSYGVAVVPTGLFLGSAFSVLAPPAPGLAHLSTIATNNPAPDFLALSIGSTLAPTNVIANAGGIARTPSGGLAARDASLQRIVMLRSIPTGPAGVDFVLGQPDNAHIVSSPTSASVVGTVSQFLGGGKIVSIPDYHRLLIFDTPPSYNFEPASRVVGQAGFTTNGIVDYRGISASTLAGPADVAVSGGILAVADRGNNRVLLFNSNGSATNAPASVVLGQGDAASYVPNLDQQTPSAARVSGPSGVALDGTHLIVSDTENHRVLIWNAVPTKTGTPADLVLGQKDFVSRRPNHGLSDGNGDGNSDTDASGFFYPMGVASDGTHLFVADRLNNRVLVWNSFPTTIGQPADAVIGQPDFTTVPPNAGNGPFTFTMNGLNLPAGLFLSGTSLWIADTENNRLVRWDAVTTSPVPGVVVGQPSGTAVTNPNYEVPTDVSVGYASIPPQTTSSTSILHPRDVAVVGGRIYVSELDSNRVHIFDATSFVSEGELGQPSDAVGMPNVNGVTAASLNTPQGLASDGASLWVADSANHRVLAWDLATPPSTGASASRVIGQPSLVTSGFDQSSTAVGGATATPEGLFFANSSLYIADSQNNRVLQLSTPVSTGEVPKHIYGQPNGTLALPNSGGSPTAKSTNTPHDVYADAHHVIVADTGNNRVLVYDTSSSDQAAILVLGQPTFTSSNANTPNASASTMQGPEGVYSDGESLWVADTGNHRVLIWRTFPTKNGQAADLVLGQSSFSNVFSNQGANSANASSLALPAGVIVVQGVLYIADSGNNRVVFHLAAPTSSGANADGVLGQDNFTVRSPAVAPDDLTHLAGPVALASDVENLYVADRDLGRAVVYSLGTLKSASSATSTIGSSGGLTLTAPGGIAVERTSLFTSRLFVSNSANNDVQLIDSVSRLVVP